MRTFYVLSLLFLFTISGCSSDRQEFSGERAYRDVIKQVSFGPRIPGGQAHKNTLEWMESQLSSAGWDTHRQEGIYKDQYVQNLVASNTDGLPVILLGAHYDSRIVADKNDLIVNNAPVPGANDGASGVAVLLELARTLPDDTVPIWMVFFDAEDNGSLPGWDWILGSNFFVSENALNYKAVIIVDMIGDEDLQIYQEVNSTPWLTGSIWSQAEALGYQDQFIPTTKYSMLDDHTSFLAAGFPTTLIIDFDYPYWHTTSDTPDKVSSESLEVVGLTLWHWIVSYKYP